MEEEAHQDLTSGKIKNKILADLLLAGVDMSHRRAEYALEKEIVEKLENLTDRGVIVWEKEGQTFRATWQGMIFEVEGTGQNWLIINEENGQNLETIMDVAGFTYVSSLLEAAKRQVTNARRPIPYFSIPNPRPGRLTNILETISKEA